MLPPENLKPRDNNPSQEQAEHEAYGFGVRIPLFKLKGGAVYDPERYGRAYKAQLLLKTQVLPELPFTINLGRPAVGGHLNTHNNPRQLRVEGDLAPLENAKLAQKRRNQVAILGPHEDYLYRFTRGARRTLTSLRLRVYDGEDGKVYEAAPSERELNYGKLVFEDDFSEIHLDNEGKTIWQDDKKVTLVYNLDGTTGGENTEAEFILRNNPSIRAK